MPKLNTPLKLSSVFKAKIWGQEDLSPLFKRPAAQDRPPTPAKRGSPVSSAVGDDPIGEVWITDDHSRFLNGPAANLTLAEGYKTFQNDLCGSNPKGCSFPILAKYIFTSDWLSIQVHPDDEYARLHEPGNVGKCEMWYILHAEPEAEILLGLKANTSKETLRSACEKGASKGLFHSFHPKAGEAVFVPPGTAHALGPGLVLFEAEQNSDLTYRLDDFGRVGLNGKPRPLHLRKGLEVTQPELPPHRDLPRLTVRENGVVRRYVVASRYFAVEEWTFRKMVRCKATQNRAETLSILSGEGRVEAASGWLGYHPGDTWLIPPAAGEYRLAATEETRLLKFYVPDLDRDFRRPLADRKFKKAQIDRVVFD